MSVHVPKEAPSTAVPQRDIGSQAENVLFQDEKLERERRNGYMPRTYEPYALTRREKRDKAHAKVQARKKGVSLSKFCKKSGSRYCRLARCIRKTEPRERRGEIKSAVGVCRASVYRK